jgi:protein ImuB
MLWACIRLPDLSLQLRLRGAELSGPLVVTSSGNRPQVLSCNPPARSHGIRPGMTVSAAVALAPDLVEHVRDPAAEMRALRNLAAWAGQFTSIVCLVRPDAALLEIAGSLRLFGGLRLLLLQIETGLLDLGYTAALTAAPTPTGACLLARAGTGARISDPAQLQPALAPLPLVLLDQPQETMRTLAAMGVHTIGECLALPRDGLARRFGQPLLDELDRALGRLPDAREPYVHPTRYSSKLALPAPVQETEPLLFAAKRLLLELAGYLRMQQTGVTRLELTLHHEDRKPTVVMLGFAVPCRDAERMVRLLRERLTNIELSDRVEAIAIDSRETRPLGSRNLSLFPEDRLPEEQRWLIIEHLRARLGAHAVHGIASHPDHRPEHAWRACEPGTDAASGMLSTRPLWLLEMPWRLPVQEKEAQAPVTLTLSPGGRSEPSSLILLAGPERIESGWWDDGDTARDYFVAVDAAGRKLWVFRDRRDERAWYLHGLFG